MDCTRSIIDNQPNDVTMKAMKSAKLWVFALAQTIHSLGLTLGPNYVVSSRNKKQIALMRDTTLTVLINVLVVFVVGSVTFGAVGHLCVIWRQELSSSFFHKDPGEHRSSR